MESNKSSLLNKLTVVVPTYCRQKYILRQLNYWEKLPVKLIILDGSPKALAIENLQNLRKNFHYIHSPTSIENRLVESLDYVSSEFVVLLSDDEFFLPSALESCVLFLEENIEYSCCKGQAIGFDIKSHQLLGRKVYPDLLNYSIGSENPTQRAYDHMLNYEIASLWSVQRLIVYGACVKAVSHFFPYSSAGIVEMQFSLVTAFHGKVKVINELMWLRSFENSNIWWSEGNVHLKKWWCEKSYSDEHQNFLSSIVFALSFVNLKSISVSDVKKAFLAYVGYCDDRISVIKVFKNLFHKLFKILLPNYLLLFLTKKLNLSGNQVLEFQSFDEVSKNIMTKGVKIDFRQLEIIKKCIVNFHEN